MAKRKASTPTTPRQLPVRFNERSWDALLKLQSRLSRDTEDQRETFSQIIRWAVIHFEQVAADVDRFGVPIRSHAPDPMDTGKSSPLAGSPKASAGGSR